MHSEPRFELIRVTNGTILNVVVMQNSDQYQILEVQVDGKKCDVLKSRPVLHVVTRSESTSEMACLHLLNLYTMSLGCWSVCALANWNVWVVFLTIYVAFAMLAIMLWKVYSIREEQKQLRAYLFRLNRESKSSG